MQKKEEVLKEFDRMFGKGPSVPRVFLEQLLDIRDTLDDINDNLNLIEERGRSDH